MLRDTLTTKKLTQTAKKNKNYAPHRRTIPKARPQKKYDFTERLQAGHEFEQDTALFDEFRVHGLELLDTGLDCYPTRTKERIIYYENPAALFFRHLSDKVAQHVGFDLGFFVDAKSTLTNTANYSIALSAYRTQKQITGITGADLLYVFPCQSGSFKACWIQDIESTTPRYITDPQALRNNRGSGQPFMLIEKNKLPPLKDALQDYLKTEVGKVMGAVA